jgi:integrase
MPARRRRRGARQRRAQGTIVPRGSDRWLIRWFVGQDAVTGKRRYSSRTVKGSKAEAIRALAQECGAVRGEVQDGGTLREFLTRWLADVLALRVSTKTLRSYTGQLTPVIEKLGKKLGKLRLDRLRTGDIQALYAALSSQGLSPRTVRYLHTILKAALDHAVHARLIQENPARGPIALPRKEHREPQVWTGEQFNAFLTAVQGDKRLQADHLLWYTLLHTGMRPGEAFGLKWADLEGRRLRVMRAVAEAAPGRYEVKEPKTRHGIRSIVLTQEHKRWLEARRGAPDAFVFPACSTSSRPKAAHTPDYPHDNRMSARVRFANAVARVNRARVKAELTPLPTIRLYDLRHSHATALLRAGVHPKIVAERLGHANITVTLQTYSHVLPTMQEDAVDAYAQSLKEGRDDAA